MSSEPKEVALEISHQVWERSVELARAPLDNPEMIWIVAPLLMATIFMTLYFARYKKEELGWNTAFGNTMVFLFVALNIIKEMYYQEGVGSIDNIFSNNLYFSISSGLIIASIVLMYLTYMHLIPKRLAFFLFAAAPINVSIYVVMAVVYANLAADYLTIMAGLVFLIIILTTLKLLQLFLRWWGIEAGKLERLDILEEKVDKIEEEKRGKKLKKKKEEEEDEEEVYGGEI